jgi:hypothetical protein
MFPVFKKLFQLLILSLSLSLSLSLPLSLIHMLILSKFVALYHIISLSHSFLYLSFSSFVSSTCSYTLSIMTYIIHSLPFALSPSLVLCLIQMVILSLSFKAFITHCLPFACSLSLSLSPRPSLCHTHSHTVSLPFALSLSLLLLLLLCLIHKLVMFLVCGGYHTLSPFCSSYLSLSPFFVS